MATRYTLIALGLPCLIGNDCNAFLLGRSGFMNSHEIILATNDREFCSVWPLHGVRDPHGVLVGKNHVSPLARSGGSEFGS